MSDLRELYQQVIIDHGRHPRNYGELGDANYTQEGFNPLCGDRITIYIKEDQGIVKDISFKGNGCAISMASASMMTEALKNKSIDVVSQFFENFHQLVTGNANPELFTKIGKLQVLGGVAEYPVRVKCATLCWHTVMAALRKSVDVVSTE